MDRGAWQVTVHGVRKESDTTEQLHFCPTQWFNSQGEESPSIHPDGEDPMAGTALPSSLTNPAPGTVGWLLWLGRVLDMLNPAWVWRVEEPALCWEQETPTPPL